MGTRKEKSNHYSKYDSNTLNNIMWNRGKKKKKNLMYNLECVCVNMLKALITYKILSS